MGHAATALLRVFCAEDGSYGNPLGVFVDGAEVAEGERQAVAADLGLSETVFVDDAEQRRGPDLHAGRRARLRGPPGGGTAWLLDGVARCATPAGEVPVTREGDEVFVAAHPDWGPP